MLTNPKSTFPLYASHGHQPILATDPASGTVYDVAPFVHLLKQYKENEAKKNDEPLWEKIENSIRIVMQWVDPDAEIRVVQQLHELMFELRDVTRDSKEFCPQHTTSAQ